ncbi:FecR family protein [Ensifer adhaerens]|uniref:FecR domain-containing protein n=1 Tax=Ensifer adhaerens TaxID=106592 RepID=A0A9Q9DDP1_ENSAD|nr:FecR domain-containing protein [Ensifer adhaerens]USJ27521.1 FecR domain-containing protein [Ensifer adhaerens]
MGHDRPYSAGEHGFVHPDAVMDAALNWFFLLQGEPDNREITAKFEEWRSADPTHDSTFKEVAAAWALPETDEVARIFDQRLGRRDASLPATVVAFRRPKRTHVHWLGAMAATVLVTIGIQQYPSLSIQWQADYATAAGVQREVTLPDGSTVVLNTDTAIALGFEGNTRSVRLLKGEAYFDVVHDPSRPFEVVAAFSEVEVKGTAFSVRRDDDEDAIFLERGHVEVRSLADPRDRADLEPGQAITATATAISAVQPMDGSVTFAWLKGQIVFENEPFSAVLGELARYYGHSVVSSWSGFDDVAVNGRYRLDDPERAIRSLATTVGATVTRLPGGILILR